MISTDTPNFASTVTEAYSLEVSAKDIGALTNAAPRILPGCAMFIPYLPGQNEAARLAAAQMVRSLGFEPVPHLSARRIGSLGELQACIARLVDEAGVTRCLVIAGDPSTPKGPFPDSVSLIETGVFERSGIRTIAVAGHPEGHPILRTKEQWDVLERKCRSIQERGMAPLIVTQFGFDADIVVTWLEALRARGMTHPVRVGVPGPASVAVLARYAASCGVGACASALSNYGISIGKLFGNAGPDRFVDRLASRVTKAHGDVRLHLFPFGGLAQSVEWVAHYRSRASQQDRMRSVRADQA
ncbi:methylenetetrahydrofolate reductase [Xanthomonas euvesicatoria pv. eucalypti]|uniref:methylenetetrahydrofolate reductase n=1 Tax=Xanthomonas euvesicatoria TaxID=456327 RepID=UPI0026E22F9F|nr:methylenetetrahydrofolate reductase [Xanthomonas euvesicatoria pv. eucalypti]MDO7935964.1 methylenetetrahydrofolate reductase [Xanthomonas euvesicatoria pv. eucalypti]MDO7940151.1 methylenetetrahydrofolate reductase [Xanthomonas euvesicatoria pv. eucalypti]MDO7944830.1 methylenetetrahydrofolate reductase [Xanthomonas euvesicatoria pv. eucalypti]MDO7947485.1 methylenetetrahydrofolate reductase [Xanthomonas euvesicatoria pv. eucalypti]